jgi:hypothetical protein
MTTHSHALDALDAPEDLETVGVPLSPSGRGALVRVLVALALFGLSGTALAGKRHTVWAYPPGAGPTGAVELETWITTSREKRDSGTNAEYRVEIENGLTDDVSLDVYLAVLTQTPEEGTKFDAVQASLRANLLGDELRGTVDLTGYFEIKRDIDFSNPWEFEAILIGGKSYGRISYDFNLVYESEISSRAFEKSARELKGIVGLGYELTPRIWAGGEFIAENAPGGAREFSIGPTISVGLTPRTWLAIGPQFGLNDDTEHLKVRALFGIFF